MRGNSYSPSLSVEENTVSRLSGPPSILKLPILPLHFSDEDREAQRGSSTCPVTANNQLVAEGGWDTALVPNSD